MPKDLPYSYGEDRLVLLVRDQAWAYAYWDFTPGTWDSARRKLEHDPSLKPMMRIHDLTSKKITRVLIALEAQNW